MQATEPATVLVVGDSAWGAAVAKALKALPNLLVLTTRLGKEGENGEVAFKIDATPKGIAARLSELNVRLVVNCLGWGSSGTMLLLGGVMNSTHYLDASKTGCCQVHEGLHELAIRQGATCVLHCAGLVPSVADLIATLFVDEGGGGGEDIAAHIDYFWHGTGEVDLKVQRPSLIGMGKEIKFDTINAVVFALESDGKEGVCIGMVSEWFTKALDWLPAGLMQWVGNRYGQAVSLRVSVMGKDNCLRVHRQTHASALQSEAQLVAFQALELLSPSSSSSACPQDEDKVPPGVWTLQQAFVGSRRRRIIQQAVLLAQHSDTSYSSSSSSLNSNAQQDVAMPPVLWLTGLAISPVALLLVGMWEWSVMWVVIWCGLMVVLF